MSISAKQIADLRASTGAGMMACKDALEEAAGNIEQAVEILRKKGIAKAAKRAGKIAAEGVIVSYIHGNKVGVLVEVNCETDFVAKNEKFVALANDIAMHIAAVSPQYVTRDQVPAELVEKEKALHAEMLKTEGKPEAMIEKITEGKLNKFFSDICLMEQAYIKDEEKTIEQLLTEKTAEIGEKVTVRRFSRFVVGEGIEREEKDFVKEVSEQLGQ